MRIRILHVAIVACSICCAVAAGAQPWKSPLRIAYSNDGISFSAPAIFQDSSGVPSVIRWKGDTLICAFQWFRQPQSSPSWDRVAVKFSYNNGLSWTVPTPIVVNGLPGNYQRPFDPTLCAFGKDSLRIYFSSSAGMPIGGQDSSINTYSAKSADGVQYFFEPGARVDEPMSRVIDPAVAYFNSLWHYTAPVGAPQQGAYHYTSPDGLNFSPQPLISSDNIHNWTGNLMVDSGSALRFYGCGGTPIWFSRSLTGGAWSSYFNTNIQGGDPSVVQLANGSYVMVFVGQPYPTGIAESVVGRAPYFVWPNPSSSTIGVCGMTEYDFSVCNTEGFLLKKGSTVNNNVIIDDLPPGVYLLQVLEPQGKTSRIFPFVRR